MKLAGKTDVGRVRQDNQDDYRAGELPGDAAWLLVCDGMGGARGGREASQSACDVIERCFQEQYASKCLPGEEETFLKKGPPFPPRAPLFPPKNFYQATKKGRQGVLFSWPRDGRCHPLPALFKNHIWTTRPGGGPCFQDTVPPRMAGFGEGGAWGRNPLFAASKRGLLPRSDSYFCQRAV